MAKKNKKGGMPLIVMIILIVAAAAGAYFYTLNSYMREKYAGSAMAYSRNLIRNMDESDPDYKYVKKYYTEEQLANIRSNTVSVEETSDNSETGNTEKDDGIEIVPVYGSTYEGYLMLVHDPSDISVEVNPYLGTGADAPDLDTYVETNKAMGGINGGGFEDVGGNGNGSIPEGIVIHEGKIVYGSPSSYQTVIGVDNNNKLICAGMTGQQAIDWGLQEAVTFDPVFINNYEVVYKQTSHLAMLNPRTAVGQRSDGTFMLLVIDGRGPTSFGALYEDVIKIFQANDAVMAANLDGGNSSAMMWNGEYVNTPVSMYGSRNLPTVFLVKEGN